MSLYSAHICFGSLAPALTSLEKGDPNPGCSVYMDSPCLLSPDQLWGLTLLECLMTRVFALRKMVMPIPRRSCPSNGVKYVTGMGVPQKFWKNCVLTTLLPCPAQVLAHSRC